MYTILIIDDDLDYQYLLARLLELQGFKVYETSNPLDAMPVIQKENIDLIAMELKNTYLNGSHLMDWLNEANLNIPILIITAINYKEAQVMAKELKSKYILQKPSYKSKIMDKINKILKQ